MRPKCSPASTPDGSITLFIGAACRTALPGTAGLAAVNGAIMQMAYTLTKDLAPLRVNAISPGMVDTPAYDWMNAEQKQAMFEQTGNNLPVKRIGIAVPVLKNKLDNKTCFGYSDVHWLR